MKEKVKHYAKELVIFFIIMTLLANIMSYYRSGDLNKDSFSVLSITLHDGKKFKVATDKPLLVHFWATWCPTCKLEASNIELISQNYDVLTIAVKSGSNREIEKFLEENSLSFKVLNDQEGIFSSEYKIAAFPTTFIYGRDKKLIFSDVGYTSTWGLWLRMWWAGL
jgi:thiol-disulfide isomerase/thioredoxin